MRAAVFLAAMAIGGCGQRPAPAVRCAVRPADFRTFADPDWMGPGIPIEPPHPSEVAIDRAGRLAWNGTPLAGASETARWATLDQYLTAAAGLQPMPFVTLTFGQGTSCATVGRVRALMRRHLACAETRRCFQGPPPP